MWRRGNRVSGNIVCNVSPFRRRRPELAAPGVLAHPGEFPAVVLVRCAVAGVLGREAMAEAAQAAVMGREEPAVLACGWGDLIQNGASPGLD